MKKVCIIGAGTAGLVLAKELANHGIEVKVYDAKRKVSDYSNKASGILSKTGLENTGIGYKDAIINTLTGAILHSKNAMLKIKAAEAKAYILDRALLSEICKKEAEEAGAKILLGNRISGDELKEMQKECSVLVGADGAVSTVANTFKFPSILDYILTYKAECRNVRINDESLVELYFDKDITSDFFGWIAPYSNSVIEIGIGVGSKYKKNSGSVFNEFIKTSSISNKVKESEITNGQASLIPISIRKKTVIGNVLLVGDAAGQVKATTGGGIIFGAMCAKIAADAIWKNISHGKKLNQYETEWRRKCGTDLYIHKLIHNYYSMLGNNQMDTLFRTMKALKAEEFFSRYGNMDSPKEMIKKFFFRNFIK